MGRSGYSEDGDYDQWAYIRWQGAVKKAITGKRGQSFLREMLAALDALPEKKLIADELIVEDGAVCAIGAVGKMRGLDMTNIDPHDPETVAGKFGVADALAREIVYANDEGGSFKESPEQRFERMRRWVEIQIRTPQSV